MFRLLLFTLKQIRLNTILAVTVLITALLFLNKYLNHSVADQNHNQTSKQMAGNTHNHYWLLLHRKSNIEYLYQGEPGNSTNSQLIKTFKVKTGIPNDRPTPLPQMLGKQYWQLIDKYPTSNPETGPYFLKLDIPVSEGPPYGPHPYIECGPWADQQCDWQTPGPFGLHGIGDDPTRLSELNPGSSGCIRHTTEDITYLYSLLYTHQSPPIRYYVEDI